MSSLIVFLWHAHCLRLQSAGAGSAPRASTQQHHNTVTMALFPSILGDFRPHTLHPRQPCSTISGPHFGSAVIRRTKVVNIGLADKSRWLYGTARRDRAERVRHWRVRRAGGPGGVNLQLALLAELEYWWVWWLPAGTGTGGSGGRRPRWRSGLPPFSPLRPPTLLAGTKPPMHGYRQCRDPAKT